MNARQQTLPQIAAASARLSQGFSAFIMAVALGSALLLSTPASAQLFGERPPPVPPAPVGSAPQAPAMSLAPSGPAAVPPSDAMPLSPSPPVAAQPAPQPSIPAGQGVVSLSARFGADAGAITGGLVWRVYSDKPDAAGAVRLVREDKSPAPNIVLPMGRYVVHCTMGLASSVRTVTVQQDATREIFDLPAGGLRIEGRVGGAKIPPGQISFDVYRGSQFETVERSPIVQRVPAGDVVVVPEGTYYIVSNYGDANSVVRSDIRVQVGKLTDVTVQHRAAVITLKLVTERGGEALANTAWSVLTPGGDVIKESTGAFPSVVLAEGEYRAIARNEGRVFEREFKVVTGVDGEVEVRTAR